jgi:hypothetical protein|nr:MAG TPA: portal [Caudoviricetes sp.]
MSIFTARRERRELQEATRELQESIADLEQAWAQNTEWRSIAAAAETEFSLSGIQNIAETCRVLAVADPLGKRGVSIRTSYVFGSGIGITCDEESGVNEFVQDFLDDPDNRISLTGHSAHQALGVHEAADGNIFFLLFTDPATGRTVVRTESIEHIEKILPMQEDSARPALYLRSHYQDGRTTKTWHPALNFQPVNKYAELDGVPVDWNTPIYHHAVNRIPMSLLGTPDLFAASPWISAYKNYLQDWARLMRAISKISHRITGKTSRAVQEARSAIQQAAAATQPGAIGLVDAEITTMPNTGATIDAESGKPLAAMIAAALGVPVTMLLADPGQTGARAVAETLDRPLQLEIEARRRTWEETYRAIINHIINTQTTLGNLPQDAPLTITFHWDDITPEPTQAQLDAITTADQLGVLPLEQTALLAMRALGITDPDEKINELRDADGQIHRTTETTGDALIRAAYAGEIK